MAVTEVTVDPEEVVYASADASFQFEDVDKECDDDDGADDPRESTDEETSNVYHLYCKYPHGNKLKLFLTSEYSAAPQRRKAYSRTFALGEKTLHQISNKGLSLVYILVPPPDYYPSGCFVHVYFNCSRAMLEILMRHEHPRAFLPSRTRLSRRVTGIQSPSVEKASQKCGPFSQENPIQSL